MFTVAPIGTTKDDISFFIFRLLSAVFKVRGIVAELLEEKISREHVDAHRRQACLRIVGRRLRVGRLLLETANALVGVDLHDAEGARGGVGTRLDEFTLGKR